VHAEFTEVQVQCDAAYRRLVEKVRICKKKPYWTAENRKKLFSDESHFFVPDKYSRLIKIRMREQLILPIAMS